MMITRLMLHCPSKRLSSMEGYRCCISMSARSRDTVHNKHRAVRPTALLPEGLQVQVATSCRVRQVRRGSLSGLYHCPRPAQAAAGTTTTAATEMQRHRPSATRSIHAQRHPLTLGLGFSFTPLGTGTGLDMHIVSNAQHFSPHAQPRDLRCLRAGDFANSVPRLHIRRSRFLSLVLVLVSRPASGL